MVSKLKPTFITDEFVKAILDSIATGNKITLTTSIGSSTIYTDQQLNGINYQQTQGSSKNITAPLNSAVVKLDTNTIIIELDLTNENLNNDFQIATVLINGKYKGNDLLVGVVRFEAPELFPKYDSTTGSIYEIKSRVYLSLSNISNATIAVSNAGMATAQSVQDLRTYVDGAFNSDIARKSIDNIYNGNNTYNKKIIAPAGLQGNSDSSDKLQTARTIQTNLASTTATSFDGTANVVPGVTGTLPIANGGTGNTNGSAVKLTTARKIGGVAFDGGSDINLPGVNTAGNQNTSGKAATAGRADTAAKADSSTTADFLNTHQAVFTDFADVAKSPEKYNGINALYNQKIANSPYDDNLIYGITTVFTRNMNAAVSTGGYITLYNYQYNEFWVVAFNNSVLGTWKKLSDDSKVVHNTGNETIAGNKTFTSPINGKTIKIELPNGTDLDNVTEYGSYSGYGTSFLNLPTSIELQFDMVVMQQGVFSSQIIISYTGGTSLVHYRSLVNGVWQPWKKLSDDSTVVHNSGSQSIAGSLTIPVDNSMINVGNDADLAMVKKQGQVGTLVVGSGKTFRIQKSNNAKILPTDTMTDLMSIDSNGNIRANAFIGSVIGRDANFSDFSVVASDMYKYSGIWLLFNANLTTAPGGTLNNVYGVVNVVPGKETGTGYIEIITYPKGRNVTYKTGVDKGYISGWYQLAKQDEVVHNTGDETIGGKKIFTDDIKMQGNFGEVLTTFSFSGANFSSFEGTGQVVRIGNMIVYDFRGISGTLKTGLNSGSYYNVDIKAITGAFPNLGSIWLPIALQTSSNAGVVEGVIMTGTADLSVTTIRIKPSSNMTATNGTYIRFGGATTFL